MTTTTESSESPQWDAAGDKIWMLSVERPDLAGNIHLYVSETEDEGDGVCFAWYASFEDSAGNLHQHNWRTPSGWEPSLAGSQKAAEDFAAIAQWSGDEYTPGTLHLPPPTADEHVATLKDEAAAMDLLWALERRFGWATAIWNRSDIDERAEREVSDAEWEAITETRAWGVISDIAYTNVSESDILWRAMEEAGVPTQDEIEHPTRPCANCGLAIHLAHADPDVWVHSGNRHTVCNWSEGMDPTDIVATPATSEESPS